MGVDEHRMRVLGTQDHEHGVDEHRMSVLGTQDHEHGSR